jgi:regulator of RNase E activity RraB
MKSDWSFYLTNVNGSLASIYLDLGLRDELPLSSKPWLLWVWVEFKLPREDGFSSPEEAPTLFEIEDSLTGALKTVGNAILSGRITTLARREFYFYGETETGFKAAVARAMSSHPDYTFQLGSKSDPEWGQYLEVLYPSSSQLELIKNMQLLDHLARRGDVPSIPRRVEHWMYFPTAEARESFKNAAVGANFEIGHIHSVEGDLPFAVTVAREQPLSQKEIDATTLQLLDLVGRFQGEYTGWETPVMTE